MTGRGRGLQTYPANTRNLLLVHTPHDSPFGCIPIPTGFATFSIIRCGLCTKVFRKNNTHPEEPIFKCPSCGHYHNGDYEEDQPDDGSSLEHNPDDEPGDTCTTCIVLHQSIGIRCGNCFRRQDLQPRDWGQNNAKADRLVPASTHCENCCGEFDSNSSLAYELLWTRPREDSDIITFKIFEFGVMEEPILDRREGCRFDVDLGEELKRFRREAKHRHRFCEPVIWEEWCQFRYDWGVHPGWDGAENSPRWEESNRQGRSEAEAMIHWGNDCFHKATRYGRLKQGEETEERVAEYPNLGI